MHVCRLCALMGSHSAHVLTYSVPHMLGSSYTPLRAQASPSMVCMLPPFIVCKQEEEEAFYCFCELQRRMTRDLGDLPCSCVCVRVCVCVCV